MTAPRRTPAETLAWRLRDLAARAEVLGELERQGTADPAGAHRLALGLTEATEAAERLRSEHLDRTVRGRSLDRLTEEVVRTMAGGGT